MTRRDNAHVRCPRCHLHDSLCVCSLLPRIETRTRLLLVIHHFEARKPSNTGLLAAECLPNHRVVLRGLASGAGHATTGEPPLDLGEDARPLLLYPALDAIPLDQVARGGLDDDRPVTLIVPDGNWRQAGKVRQRVPGLGDVPCVILPPEPDAPTTYRLRSEPHPQGMATMEAIARALGILEGPAVRAALEEVFLVMVERTLWSRGLLPTEKLTRALPPGVTRHDPRSGQKRSILPSG